MPVSFHHGKLYVTTVFPNRDDGQRGRDRILQVMDGMQETRAEWPTCANCGEVMDGLNESWVKFSLREKSSSGRSTTCRNCGASNRLSGTKREHTRITIEK